MRAVLLGGPRAVLSHRSAGELWGIGPSILPLAEITISPGRSCRGHRNLLAHRGSISGGERQRRHGIPVTSRKRTYLDLAAVLDDRPVERLIAEARPSSTRGLRDYARARRARAGAARLLRALDRADAGSTATQNDFEELLFALCRSHRLPDPVCQLPIGPYRVDFAWPEAGLVVETDGRATHLMPAAFEVDRERDAELGTLGWDVRRFTWRQLNDRPEWVAGKLEELLTRTPAPARRRSRPRP